MRSSRFRRILGVGMVVGAAASLMLFSAPAHAAHTDVLTLAGSDTTELLMDNVIGGAAANEYNVHAQPSSPVTVPGDSNCASQTYATTPTAGQTLAPNGSSNGRRALRDSIAGTFAVGGSTSPSVTGCVDIARSSADPSNPGTTDRPGSQYFAFALDNVSWASPSLNAPAAITFQQLQDIYNCKTTNWAQLPGGGSGQIQRVLFQSGSGTEATFLAELGFNAELVSPSGRAQDTATFGPLDLGCSSLFQIEENHGNYLTSSNTANTPAALPATYNQVIMPYSAGKFVYQANNAANPSIDIRNGVRPGGIITNPSDATTATFAPRWTGSAFLLNSAVVKETSPGVLDTVLPGTRYLYNVISPDEPSYAAAEGLVGYDNITGAGAVISPLCAGSKLSTIRSQGFLDLGAATTTGGNSVKCRIFTTS